MCVLRESFKSRDTERVISILRGIPSGSFMRSSSQTPFDFGDLIRRRRERGV